jgi:Mrp family chromosome partitioning ATPase
VSDAAGSVPVGLRITIALGLLGLLAGFLWGVADVPRYTATAGVVVPPDGGEAVDRAELARVAARAQTDRVAQAAAADLGGDVPGGDLLSDIEVVPAPRSGGIVVEATADAPDVAAATADGYADAIVSEGGDRLERGAQAAVPGEPSEDRSALKTSAIGLAAGLLAGGLVALILALRRRRAAALGASYLREDSFGHPGPGPAPAAAGSDSPDELVGAFGGPVLRARVDPGRLLTRSPEGRLALDPDGAAAIEVLADDLELDAQAPPRLIALLSPERGTGTSEVTMALAVAAADLGHSVIAVDADVESPSLAGAAAVEDAPGLADYLEGGAGPRDVLRAVALNGGHSLVCLPAGERREAAALEIDGGRLDSLLERLPRVYDLVLVAGPPVDVDGAAAALASRTDGVVLVARDEEGAPARVRDAVRELGDGSVLTGVVTFAADAQSRAQTALPTA